MRRAPLIAIGALVAVGSPLCSLAGTGKWGRISVPVLSNLFCSAPCPEGFIHRGVFVTRTTNATASNRLAFKLRLERVTDRLTSEPANFAAVRVDVGLSFNAGPCTKYSSPVAPLTAGTLKLSFIGGDTSPTIPPGPADVRLCGVSVFVDGSAEPFGLDGITIPLPGSARVP